MGTLLLDHRLELAAVLDDGIDRGTALHRVDVDRRAVDGELVVPFGQLFQPDDGRVARCAAFLADLVVHRIVPRIPERRP
jgi:hypothetical protein